MKKKTGKTAASSAPEAEVSRGGLLLVIISVCVVAAVARIFAARGELWMDEVWTLRLIAQNVHTPADLFKVAHDNNHVLNSLVMYWVGPNGAAWMYRWPAVLCGVLTVFVAGWTQRRRGTMVAIAAAVLTGASYLLVQYSSEARGYAYSMLCTMLAFAILSASDESPSVGWDGALAATCIVGFLAHPLFVVVFLAAQVWTWFPDRSRPVGRLVSEVLLRTALPGACFAWLYVVLFRHMTIGGGEPQPFGAIILQTLSVSIGGPLSSTGVPWAVAIAIALTLAAFWHVFKESPKRASFYLSAIVLLPALVLVFGPRADIYPRYFVLSVCVLLLLWSEYLGALASRTGWWRSGVVLAAFVLANGWHISQLVTLGRGSYRDVLQIMSRDTRGPQVLVVVDHKARQSMMLDYYAPRSGITKPLQLGTATTNNLHATEWLLTHDVNVDFTPEPVMTTDGVTFKLVAYYPFSGLSGWNLSLYRREQ